MSNTEVAVGKSRSLVKGLTAGLIGGLAGAVAMTLAERLFPQPQTERAPAAGALPSAAEAIPWEFGAAVGAAYGALAEYYPAATAKEGASFGMAIEALTQQTALPVLRLVSETEEPTMRDRASGLTSHIAFGLTTEWVRRLVRRIL